MAEKHSSSPRREKQSGHVATVGFNHDPSETRFEAGEAVSGLPGDVTERLARDGVIKTGKPEGGTA